MIWPLSLSWETILSKNARQVIFKSPFQSYKPQTKRTLIFTISISCSNSEKTSCGLLVAFLPNKCFQAKRKDIISRSALDSAKSLGASSVLPWNSWSSKDLQMIDSLYSIHVFVWEKKLSWVIFKLGSATGLGFRKESPLMLALCGQFCLNYCSDNPLIWFRDQIERVFLFDWFLSAFFWVIYDLRGRTILGASIKCRKTFLDSTFSILVGYFRMWQETDFVQ